MATAVRNRDSLIAKRATIVEMRLAGKTLDTIAQATNLAGASGVRYHLDAWLAELKPSAEQTEELRQTQAAQIDAVYAKLWPQLDGEDYLAVTDRLVKLMDRKARLMGLDLQQGISVTVVTREALAAALWEAEDVVVDVTPVEITEGEDEA